MRRKRTITATRLALAANILEILGIIAFSVAMFLVYVIVSAFAGAFTEGNSFAIVFKHGVAPILFALFMIVFIITLIVSGRKTKGYAEYSAEDYKNKSLLIKTFIAFSLFVAIIITVVAFWFYLSLTDPQFYLILIPLYSLICLGLAIASSVLLVLDMKEANKMVKQNAFKQISTSNYQQQTDVEKSENNNTITTTENNSDNVK